MSSDSLRPDRESYTPEAFLDTVLTTDTFRNRLSEMSVLVATSTSGEVVGTVAYKVLEAAKDTFEAWLCAQNGMDRA